VLDLNHPPQSGETDRYGS